MVASNRTPSTPVLELPDLDSAFSEPPPDSTVRAVPAEIGQAPAREPEEEEPPPSSSHVVARVATVPQATKSAPLVVRASAALLGRGTGYVTITTDGKVLFEGEIAADRAVETTVTIPVLAQHVRALLEAGSKYKDAIVILADSGVTEYTFA